MTAPRNDGGPAFPAFEKGSQGFADVATVPNRHHVGLSLRDWFAGQALPSVIGLIGIPEDGPDDLWDASIAERTYAIADRMLAERSKP